MTMWDVVDHSPDQLKLIYAAHVKERAAVKMMDMEVLTSIITTAWGKKGDKSAANTAAYLRRQMKGEEEEVIVIDLAKNRKTHVALLLGMGAGSI